MRLRQKIVKKSRVWWKHGKHGARLGAAVFFNRLARCRSRSIVEELDLARPDWSSRQRSRRGSSGL